MKQEAIEAIEDAADTIVMKAVAKVPVDLGVLKQSIGNEPRQGGLDYIVYVDAEYGPFIEFGTGTMIDVPSELAEWAKQYQGEGKRQVNIPAQPFFFDGYFEERAKLVKTLKSILKNAVR